MGFNSGFKGLNTSRRKCLRDLHCLEYIKTSEFTELVDMVNVVKKVMKNVVKNAST